MALNIKNAEVERLAAEVADLTGETKTEAVRRALAERRARLRTRVTDAGRAERVRVSHPVVLFFRGGRTTPKTPPGDDPP